jgi:hypothetical protein
MGKIVFQIILALLYLFAGLGLLLGRKRLAEGRTPNLVVPGALLILAAVTTPFL